MQAQKLFPKKLIFCHFYIYAKFKQALNGLIRQYFLTVTELVEVKVILLKISQTKRYKGLLIF